MNTEKNILVTRPLSDDQLELASGLGLKPHIAPAIDISFREDWSSVQRTVDTIKNPVFVFTSKNGVKAIEQFLAHGGVLRNNTPVYAVGQKTAGHLSGLGVAAKTPDEQNGVGLARFILRDILSDNLPSDSTILHFCGNKRRDEFRQFLNDSDIEVKDLVVYKTELKKMAIPEIPIPSNTFLQPKRRSGISEKRRFSKSTDAGAIRHWPHDRRRAEYRSGETCPHQPGTRYRGVFEICGADFG